ncbi:MAG TPA: uroporphyrinogen decarboxylase family protein [Anaerolineae bacterium]|nr:uroporphyrinogen decarboxylase family protein [Anaerolineae bacterium]
MTSQMTSRERLLAAIRHEEPDRVPVSPRIGAFLTVYYGSSSWMHHLKAAREFGFDIMLPVASPVPAFFQSPRLTYRWLPPEVVVQQEIEEQDGAVTVRRTFDTPAGQLSDETYLAPPGREYGVSPSPVKREYLVKDMHDLDRLRYLLPDPTHSQLAEYHEIARIVGDVGIVEVTFNPPLDHFLGDVRALPQLMMDYYLDHPLFEGLFATFQRYSLALLEAVLEEGVRFIFGTWYYASLSAGWSPAIFRTCFVPLIRQHADLVHRYDGIYHVYDDGKMMRTLGDYVDAGADVVETLTPPPVGDVDLAEAKRRYGDRTCLKGYVDLLYVLKMGTPALVERTVREAIEVAAPGGGFILGTSDSIREGTPMANLNAYFEAARTYGAYR